MSHYWLEDRSSERERSQVTSTVATGRALGNDMRLNHRIRGWSWLATFFLSMVDPEIEGNVRESCRWKSCDFKYREITIAVVWNQGETDS